MKKLLIIGASMLQLPAIIRAKEMGHCVATADYDPKAVGIQYADEYFNISTINEQGVYEAAKTFRADGVMTLATDMPMRSVAYTCEKLGLVGISYDTAIKSTDKGEMMKAFAAAGVNHPWYHIVNGPEDVITVLDRLTYPCITKPTDNSGSRGVMLINNRDELENAIKYSSTKGRKGSIIIEEYMLGPEVSVEVIVLDGTPHVLQVTDKLTTGAPHFVEMGHSQPSQLPVQALSAIRALAAKAVLSVGIHNGPAHVEIILTEQGPKIVELGARMGGDCITTHLVPLSTGVDMVQAAIQIALGEVADIVLSLSRGAAIRYFDAPTGQIRAITGLEHAKNVDGVKEVSFFKQVGDQTEGIGNSGDRIGFVVTTGSNANEAVARCAEAMSKISIEIKQ